MKRRRRSTFRPAEEGRCFLELLGVTGIAIAQPVLDTLGKNADTFIAREARRPVILAITFTVTLAPALGLWAIEALTALFSGRARHKLHLALLASGAGVIALEVVKRNTSWSPVVLVVIGVAAAVLAGVGLARFSSLRLWPRYLAAAPVAFAALFLFATPINDVLFNHTGRVVDVQAKRPAPVVLIILDELPEVSLLDGEGHIDRDVYPHFAALADETTWYRNSTTVALFTRNAVPAILTGRSPRDPNDAPTVNRHPENLFTLLGHDYRVNGNERVTQLCPVRLCARPSNELTAYRSVMGEAFKILGRVALPRRIASSPVFTTQFVSGEAPDVRFRQFIDSLQNSNRPTLNVLHVELPHTPWKYVASGQRYDAGPTEIAEGLVFHVWLDDSYAEAARVRHLLQVQYADRLIGETVARLKRKGLWDESLVVVTADHGAAFTGREGFRDFSRATAPQTMWTPLFIKAPGQLAGEVSDVDARSIDVLPTIADLLGVDLPWKVDGKSLLGPRPDASERSVIRFDGRSERIDGRAGFQAVLRSGIPRGTGEPSFRLFQGGRFGHLVGTRVDALPRGPTPSFTARFDEPQAFDAVDPKARTLPLYVSGAVDTFPPGRVVVSVNGVIGGWSELHGKLARRGDQILETHKFRTFSTVIPASLLKRGRNDVQLFLIDGEPGSERLRPLGLGGAF